MDFVKMETILLMIALSVANVLCQTTGEISLPTTTSTISSTQFSSILNTSFNCSHWDVTNHSIVGYFPMTNYTAYAADEFRNVTGKIENNYVTFAPLKPGCIYNLTVLSVSATCEHREATVAASVTNADIQPINTTSLLVTWTNADGCVKQYNVTREGQVYETHANHTVIPGLQPGCKHNVTIITEGYGDRSAAVEVTNATVAASVTNANIQPINTTSLLVTWTNADGCVKQYNVDLQGQVYETHANHTVIPGLQPGCKYSVTIITEGYGDRSAAVEVTNATVAETVADVTITAVNFTTVQVSWPNATGCVKQYDVFVNNVTYTTEKNHTAAEVHAGCEYEIAIITVGEGGKSAVVKREGFLPAIPVHSVTVLSLNISALRIQWNKVFGCVKRYKVTINDTEKYTRDTSMVLSHLLPGHNYTVGVTVEGLGESSSVVTNMNNTYPEMLRDVRCGYASSGYSLFLSWASPLGVWTSVEVNVTGLLAHHIFGTETSVHINGVQPAKSYHITLISFSGGLKSIPVTIRCQTDPRGVIAGSITAILLFILLILTVFYIWRHKPYLFRQKLNSESKSVDHKYRAIPVSKFADHFNRMSCDQDRGFSEEYEEFNTVGLEQTSKVAQIPVNRDKNRFTNVVPCEFWQSELMAENYDWSRVKLSRVGNDPNSDYINANYMPGYGNNSRQYIAAQGPLPCTVEDFWRMVWEQCVYTVVMVTNCSEGGRVKCEHYWPLDYTACTYGSCSVLVTSEQKKSSWTLRDFTVTNNVTSEVRTVKHFHFTAWPDHGVPEKTSELIEFRDLIRHHIEACDFTGPTVVHCSAGVGRTGTIIALDVVLQQLHRERVIGLADIVHRMRLSRPLMVQTECQYVFLHQCIMDIITNANEKASKDPIYENSDMIYVNTVALKHLQSSTPEM